MEVAIVKQLQLVGKSTIPRDILAGLTVSVMLIPQGMAYALLAGLPPIYGLYAGFLPLLIYPLFGSSRQMSVGPVALTSILVFSGISAFAQPGSEEFIQLAILTAFLVGIVQLIFSGLRMGFLANFLSLPVISGFTSAAAIIIAVGQLKYFFGLEVERSNTVFNELIDLSIHLPALNPYDLVLGSVSLALIMGIKKVNRFIPGALIAVILGTVATYFFNLTDHGVEVVGRVPEGLPSFGVPSITVEHIINLLPLAFIISLISFIGSLAIAKTISAKNNHYPIDANQELFSIGLSQAVGSFFQVFPGMGSFTRSAVNDDVGAQTGLASVFAAIFIGLIMLFFTNYFYYLPHSILAAVVLSAVFGLIEIKKSINLLKLDRTDFYSLFVTFILTLLLGVQTGVFAGIGLSILMIVYKASKPHFAFLGRIQGTNTFRNIKRFSDLDIDQSSIILRYDSDLFFGNAKHFYDTVICSLQSNPEARLFVLDASTIAHVDSTALHYLELIVEELDKAGIQFYLSGLKGPVRDIFHKAGLNEKIPFDHQFLNIEDALQHFHREQAEYERKVYVQQRNIE
ncbi:MAG: sulfate permease [Saprospiraceae bacterium]|nr:sulfate permease [Saprospiraceae bacterium]